jgi:hypothetical protein
VKLIRAAQGNGCFVLIFPVFARFSKRTTINPAMDEGRVREEKGARDEC